MNEIPLINYDGMPQTRGFWSGDLPHWDVYGRPIFMTLHVKGAIPREAANKIREDIARWRSSTVADGGPACSENAGCRMPTSGRGRPQRVVEQDQGEEMRSSVAHVGPTCASGDAEVGPSLRRNGYGGQATSATKRSNTTRIQSDFAATETEYTRRLKQVFKNMERWLDRADQPPLLTQKGVSEMIRDAIEQRERRGWWRILQWTLMPSHLHVLYVGGQVGMQEVMTDFKRWTGRRATAILDRRGQPFWQTEWFDHWSRSADETDRMAEYIRRNPVKAGLVKHWRDWPHGSWSDVAHGGPTSRVALRRASPDVR